MKINRSLWMKMISLWFVILSVALFGNVQNGVSIVKVSGYATQTDTSLCASLNKYLYSGDGTVAKPYITLSPKHPFSVDLNYNGICLKGLKPRTSYRFTIHKGIPLGEFKLDRDYELSGTTGDYRPSLQFEDNDYILPAKGEISIPIETINIKELAVSLYRISTKNLIGRINETGLVRGLYSYDMEKVSSTDGYFLWQKRLRIHSELNRPKVTAIPVGEFLKERKPGAYILRAQRIGSDGKPVNAYDGQTQWFMISDIGLFTLRGDNGLTVYTRRLSDAQNYDNVRLELISRNNEVLDTAVSKAGKAFFPDKVLNGKRGLRPKAIYAYGAHDDFSVIDLSKPPFDLSDRGVKGRDNPGRFDAFVYSNRGIFKPGERVPVEILLRNSLGEAEAGAKLSLKLFDSRQVEVHSALLTTDDLGHAGTTLSISTSASMGRWHLRLYAGGEKPIGSLDFLVEDFVPPKIKVDIEHAPSALKPGVESLIQASAHYLTGEPLPDAEVELRSILHKADKPFKGYESYSFGDVKERFVNEYLKTLQGRTDREGKISIPYKIDGVPRTTLPLAAFITLSVSEPGGRPVEKVIERFVEDKEGYIGIKADFDNAAVDRGSAPIFELVYLKHATLQVRRLSYHVIKEKVHWNWQSNGDGWTYNKTYSDAEELLRGTIESSEREPVTLTLPKLDWGSYRLVVTENGGRHILSSYRFSSGYEESMSKASPDRLPVATDKQTYSIGEEVKVHITPKFTGPIIVSVANHAILETKSLEAKRGEELELTFVVKKEWGSSAYILATAFRAQDKKLGASRAIGLSHLSISDPQKIIELNLDYPKRSGSSQPLKVSIEAKSVAGKKAYLTLIAVDEGVLRLTDYRSPDPVRYFFGQQKLGIQIRDIYGDLIKVRGAHAKFDVGAGDELSTSLREKPVMSRRQVVALFKREVAFGQDGKAEVTLDIPDFQGALRVMVVAWSRNSVGARSGELVVKDSISPEIYMPRFISVGDRANALLSVGFDANAEAGSYLIRFSNSAGKGSAGSQEFTYEYDGSGHGKFTTPIVLETSSPGEATLRIEVLKEGNKLKEKEWKLGIRSSYPEVSIRKVGLLTKGALFDPQALFDTSIWSDPRHITLKLSGKPLLSTSSLADELIDYWGSCAEQTTSRGMPWLFMPKTSPLAKKINIEAIVSQAIERLLAYQKLDGGFGLWSGSGAEMWVTSYVMDFLRRAKQAGYKVPERAITSGLDWIENHIDRWSIEGEKQEADVYGLYILTQNSRTLMSELLFRAKDSKSKMRSAQSWAQLGAALAHIGEDDLAIQMFEKAERALGSEGESYFSHFGGMLRDEAALAILMREAKLGLDWQQHTISVAESAAKRPYLSTQEASLLLRMAFVTDMPATALKLSSNGKSLALSNGEYVATFNDMHSLPLITNESDGACWYSLEFRAVPTLSSLRQMSGNGFTIRKKFYTFDGREADLSSVKQNDRLVVVIEGDIESSAVKYPLVTDWIPAGFELENPQISGIDPLSGLKWVGKRTESDHETFRDDRYIAVLKRSTIHGPYRAAYVVRAVTTGSFAVPPARIEDMYRPYYRAVSKLEEGRLTIRSRSSGTGISSKKSAAVSGKLANSDFDSVYTLPLGSLDRYTIIQLNTLRNAIFARAGLDFKKSNPMLYQKFSDFKWYKPSKSSSAMVYTGLSEIQKENVQKLLEEEKRRGGGLVLADFYRVRNKVLEEKDLEKYDKEQLFILRNSLFARYGVSFRSPKLQKIFSYMPWYHPTEIDSVYVFDMLMSEREKENVRLIQKMEKRLAGSSEQ